MRALFVPVGDILVQSNLAQIPFACPVERCRGGCCTVPGVEEGAPLQPEEVAVVVELLPVILPRLPVAAQRCIEQHGAVLERGGQCYTRCLPEGPCVFVVWDGDKARCAFEQAYEEGVIAFRKPLSCHLFPLRLRRHAGQCYVVFDPFEECAPAYECGRRSGQTVLGVVAAALERAFGVRWCDELRRTFGLP